MADTGSTIQTYNPVAQGDDEWLENHWMYCAWWSIMEYTNHLGILCSSTKIKLSIPMDIIFICCKKTKTQQHTHEYWPQCQPTNRWTNKLKVRWIDYHTQMPHHCCLEWHWQIWSLVRASCTCLGTFCPVHSTCCRVSCALCRLVMLPASNNTL